MPFRVHYLWELQPEDETILRAVLDEDIILTFGEDLPDPPDYQMLIDGRPPREFLEHGEKLETLLIPWAGLPEVTGELMRDFPQVKVHNLHHNAVITAESALMLLFAAAKRTIPYDQTLRKGDWRMRYGETQSVLMHHKTVLILGFGHVGQHVGQICAALGMRVLATKHTQDVALSYPAQVHHPDALHQLLPQADFVVITLPLTETTHGLLGEKELAMLPEHAVLVNVGRAAIIDQAALYAALQSGQLHAAGLDVWYNYPPSIEARTNTPPSDFPFHELDNVVMSPHRGGHVMETQQLRLQHVAQMINAAARREALPNRVDLDRGY